MVDRKTRRLLWRGIRKEGKGCRLMQKSTRGKGEFTLGRYSLLSHIGRFTNPEQGVILIARNFSVNSPFYQERDAA